MKADPVEIAPMPDGNGHGPEGRVEFLPLSRIQESTTNPRRTVKDAHFADLVTSVRTHGVLQPILVRPVHRQLAEQQRYELVAGHRRMSAAREVPLLQIPVFIRELSDQAALEIQVIENLQRSDLHALEEAQGYRRLIEMKYDVARIAERIGRSVKYVYDRVKLLQLIPAVQKLFLEDRITPGHAIILARLKPADQERAIDVDEEYGGYGNRGGALFIDEHTLFEPNEDNGDPFKKDPKADPREGMKTRSVRELQVWVDERVRFDPHAHDVPDLFPETHAIVSRAERGTEKVISITHDHVVPPEARDGKKIYGPRSWRRADGGKRAPVCDYSITGVIVIGAGRGRALPVCTAKEKCSVHWSEWQKERVARHRDSAPTFSDTPKTESAKESAAAARRREEQLKKDRDRKRWDEAVPMILPLIAAKLAKMPAGASGLGKHLIELLDDEVGIGGAKLNKLMPPGRTADDLVRHLVMGDLMSRIDQGYHDAPSEYLKPFGLDVNKLMDQVAPVQTSAKAAAAKAAKKKPAGKKAKR